MKPLRQTVKQIWKNKAQILEGLKNKVLKDQFVEKIAEQRMEICWDCDEMDTTGEHCAFPGTEPCCANCGCSLELKTRSLSASCPLNKWIAVLSQQEEDNLNAE